MQRYFIPDEQFNGDHVRITGEDARHIAKVMRMKKDDDIICCNLSGKAFYCSIESVSELDITAKIIRTLEESHELPIQVGIAQGLPKGDKLDIIIQKATELGVDTIFLYQAERSIVKWVGAPKISRKQQRLQKIAKEAAEQSHRNKIPIVTTPLSIEDILKESGVYDKKVVAYEETAKSGEMSGLKSVFKSLNPGDSLFVVIGPEGGLSDDEVAILKNNEFVACALGRRILRTETAPLYLLAAASFHFELENGVN